MSSRHRGHQQERTQAAADETEPANHDSSELIEGGRMDTPPTPLASAGEDDRVYMARWSSLSSVYVCVCVAVTACCL